MSRSSCGGSMTASSDAVHAFYDNVENLWTAGDVPVYDTLPNPLDFYRQHVARSRPCILRHHGKNGSDHWRLSWNELLTAWTTHCQQGKEEEEEEDEPCLWVDVTPDGHGDCLRRVKTTTTTLATTAQSENDANDNAAASPQSFFVKPMECRMTLAQFRKAIETNSKRKSLSLLDNDTTTDHAAMEYRIFETMHADASSKDQQQPQQEKQRGATTNLLTNPPTPPPSQGVFYYSRQNDCLRTELQPLWNNVLASRFAALTAWANTVFGQDQPQAVNLWMGPRAAVSALHKDPYENLFHVCHGTKLFTLIPPAYAPYLPERPMPSGSFVWDKSTNHHRDDHDDDDDSSSCCDGTWKVQVDPAMPDGTPCTVPWITTSREILSTCPSRVPLRHVRVQAGETLYLPSLWFHQVSQQHDTDSCSYDDHVDVTIGVNFWYDMEFASPLWAYFELLQQMQVTD